MPSSYAHYRFGVWGYSQLPEEIRKTVQRFRQLYDVGLHGPDLFFYYQPLFHTKMGNLGHTYHAVNGREFFEAAAARLRENPSEGATAYLFGLLCHFALDSSCHPMIRATAAEGKAGHTELETEFDRHLLALDGKNPPHTQNLSGHMKLTWGGCVTVSEFYPPATAYTIRRCILTMALVTRVLASKNRDLLQRVFSIGGTKSAEMVMYPRPNHKCVQLIDPLMQHYEEAQQRFASMAAQLAAAIHGEVPLGAEFDCTYG